MRCRGVCGRCLGRGCRFERWKGTRMGMDGDEMMSVDVYTLIEYAVSSKELVE